MIEIVFSGTAYGELTVATSSHPDNVNMVKQDAKEYGGGIAVKAMEKPEGILSDGTLWEAQTALYFRGFCLPDCAVL